MPWSCGWSSKSDARVKEMKMKKLDELLFNAQNGEIYGKVIRETEKMLFKKALKRAFGNQSIAAKILGINRNTLRVKIKKFGINAREFKI